jgi:hypothetical protein
MCAVCAEGMQLHVWDATVFLIPDSSTTSAVCAEKTVRCPHDKSCLYDLYAASIVLTQSNSTGGSCAGCDGVPNSDKVVDVCGVCGGDGRSCLGCDGIPNSGKVFDPCGICGGNGLSCPSLRFINDGHGGPTQDSPVACLGEPVTLSYLAPPDRTVSFLIVQSGDGLFRHTEYSPLSSSCGQCSSCSNPADAPPSCMSSGCFGCKARGDIVLQGSSLPDRVGEYEIEIVVSYGGRKNPQAYGLLMRIEGRRDACGVCGGGNTTCLGCDGVPNSGKASDQCGSCLVPSDVDFDSCVGCDGVAWSGERLDVCGVCAGDNSSCADNSYSLWVERPPGGGDGAGERGTVCAGSDITVGFRAPLNRASTNRIVMFGTELSNFPISPDVLVPPGVPSGTLTFTASSTMPGEVIYFRYYLDRDPGYGQPANTSRPVTLGDNADPCGVCGGDGSSCAGCDGVPNSGKVPDLCGDCDGDNLCVDCAGVPYGAKRLDRCSIHGPSQVYRPLHSPNPGYRVSKSQTPNHTTQFLSPKSFV